MTLADPKKLALYKPRLFVLIILEEGLLYGCYSIPALLIRLSKHNLLICRMPWYSYP